MLKVSNLNGLNVSREISATPAQSLEFLTNDHDDSNATTYTFSSVGLGDPLAKRHIIVAIAYRAGGARTINSVTINGVSASKSVTVTISATNIPHADIWIAEVPEGASGDIVITLNNTTQNIQIGVYRAINLKSTTPTDTVTDTETSSNGTTMSASPTVDEGGIGIGIAMSNDPATSFSWTNMTEDFENASEIGASSAKVADALSATVSVSLSGGGGTTRAVMAVAAFR